MVRIHVGEPSEIGVSNLYFTDDPNSTLELVASAGVPLNREFGPRSVAVSSDRSGLVAKC